jgi:hypothetical protein
MLFDQLQRAFFGGKPVLLFRFALQGAVWWFAQADDDVITADATTWRASKITCDNLRQTASRAKDNFAIRLPYLRRQIENPIEIPSTQDFGDLWHPYVPSDTISVMVLATHYGATDPPKLQWAGEVGQPEYTDTQLQLTCTPGRALAQAKRQGAKSQRACWKRPYSTGLRGCNLDPEDFYVDAVVTDVEGLTLTTSGFGVAPFSLLQGSCEWTREIEAHNGTIEITERRTIVEHSGSQVRLLYGAVGLADVTDVRGLPGCPGTRPACVERDNYINFGGLPFKPIVNPEGQAMSWGA